LFGSKEFEMGLQTNFFYKSCSRNNNGSPSVVWLYAANIYLKLLVFSNSRKITCYSGMHNYFLFVVVNIARKNLVLSLNFCLSTFYFTQRCIRRKTINIFLHQTRWANSLQHCVMLTRVINYVCVLIVKLMLKDQFS